MKAPLGGDGLECLKGEKGENGVYWYGFIVIEIRDGDTFLPSSKARDRNKWSRKLTPRAFERA